MLKTGKCTFTVSQGISLYITNGSNSKFPVLLSWDGSHFWLLDLDFFQSSHNFKCQNSFNNKNWEKKKLHKWQYLRKSFYKLVILKGRKPNCMPDTMSPTMFGLVRRPAPSNLFRPIIGKQESEL